MRWCKSGFRSNKKGFALLTVTIFAMVLTIAGMGFFALASYETKGALYRENSSEAFYLADGAVEMARAQFLKSRAWRPDSTANVALGRGTYNLKSKETTFGGYSDVVRLTATGTVKNAARRVEVMAQVPPTAYSLGILVNGNVLSTHGSFGVDGDVHVNGATDGIAGHISSGYTLTTAPPIIKPPPIYADSSHFPTSTYYIVKGDKTGPVAHIFRNGVDVTGTRNMSGIISYSSSGSGSFTYSFSGATFNNYFNETTGYFPCKAGKTSIVVDFGYVPVNPSLNTVKTNLSFNGGGGSIHATVIDARFNGVTESDRLLTGMWFGGTTTVKSTTFEPFNGIALIGYDLDVDTQGFGTTTWPDLVYLTHDLLDTHGNSQLVIGSLIILNNLEDTHGNATITYNAGFIGHLPGYLRDSWPSGIAGTMKILRWRELGI